MKTRIFALCLSLLMVISLMPLTALPVSAAECKHENIWEPFPGDGVFYCKDCGISMHGAACKHENVEEIFGDGIFYCAHCGQEVYRVTQPDETEHVHVEMSMPSKDATCTETGLTEGFYCSECGETLVAQEVIPALGHSFGDGVVTKEPTEDAAGIRTYTCTTCGETRTESIEPLDHTHGFGNWEVIAEASCEKTGTKMRSCSCGETETETIPANGHTEVIDAAVKATCTETGLTEGSHCSVCHIVITAQTETAVLGHNYQDDTCTRCGDHINTIEPANTDITRIAGGSRYTTSIAVAKELKATLGGGQFNSVVVASGLDFPDALAGTYLAAVKKAPILLIADTHIDMMKTYIDENMVDSGTIYILGSENSVSKKAADELSAVGNVKRLGGKSRFITNLRILEELDATTGELLVVYSVAPWDALSVSSSGCPILLVNETLRDDQKQYLATTSFDKITIIGSTAGVPGTMEEELRAYCPNVDRVFGSSRYKTTIEVAKYFYGTEKGSIVLACGNNFPDGLCSGALAYAKNAPVILTDAGRESLAAEYVTNYDIQKGYVIGSDKVVRDETIKTIFNLTETDVIQ